MVNESAASKTEKKDYIDNKNHQTSDFYENNLSFALCPKAELEEDCKFLFQYSISLFGIILAKGYCTQQLEKFETTFFLF